ncbi:MAG TPA: MFS transporter [Tepidisphaeraceae bacterium]|nr:MFS transporter [Tepidisphaeraceae bacterium]
MFGRYFAFRTRQQPYMVRLSYRYEMRSAMTFPLAAALAEGAFTGVVAAKYFHASPLLIALITAAPMFGNIAALLWAELGKHRRKVPFINLLQAGVITCIAAVALTRLLPLEIGGWVFALMIILTRVLASGIITLRSAIWRYNYPRSLRGQIIGRITIVATTGLALATGLGALWLDVDPGAFVWLYPLAALLGAYGIWQFSHIRVRGEGREIKQRRRATATHFTARPENLAETGESNVVNYTPPGARSLHGLLHDSLQVMRSDQRFRHYQYWQSLMGSAFMMMNPPLVFMVAQEMTDARTQYALATLVLQLIPLLSSVVFTQLWSPIFDRLHILRFRSVQGLVSVTCLAVIFAGAWFDSLWIIAVGQLLMGIANAAGALAWNLGQNDFAPPDKIATYMGIHVMLTGVRGCLAPFIGVILYQQFVGRWVFAISMLLCLIALIGFTRMARHAPSKPIRRPVHRPASPAATDRR